MLWAASAGSADAFLALVNYGASSEGVDRDGLAAIHCAASRGHKECLSILISLCGADVNLRDGNGCTALFYTVTLGFVECTGEMSGSEGQVADMIIVNTDDVTCKIKEFSSELLLECGAVTELQDRKGRSPAHCGAAKGQLDTLRMLRSHGADLAAENNKGEVLGSVLVLLSIT